MRDIGSTLMGFLIGAPMVGYVLIKIVVKPALAFSKTPASDLSRIHANLEGLVGLAGVNRKVLDIVRAGTTLPTRYTDAARIYKVTLERPDGTTERRTVNIEVGLFGEGQLTVGSVEH
jgi:hypothetical protein